MVLWVKTCFLSIHFENDKTKTFFFSRMESPPKLRIGDYFLIQPNTVEYLERYPDSSLNTEAMTCRVLKKTNTKVKFLM